MMMTQTDCQARRRVNSEHHLYDLVNRFVSEKSRGTITITSSSRWKSSGRGAWSRRHVINKKALELWRGTTTGVSARGVHHTARGTISITVRFSCFCVITSVHRFSLAAQSPIASAVHAPIDVHWVREERCRLGIIR